MHPACLPIEKLLEQCTARFQRRGGPGGQHRNKVETAVVIVHQPSGIQAEASERRSRPDNHREAILRLRFKLAAEIRTVLDLESAMPSENWQLCHARGRPVISANHENCPAIIAELLDWLRACDFELSKAGNHLGISSSRIVQTLKRYPPAFDVLNDFRLSKNLRALK